MLMECVHHCGILKEFLCCAGKPVFMYSMGGLAEYCVVPAHALTILPDSLPYTESAILGCAVFTAYGAMAHAAEVRPGDSVAVIGVGGVGSR
jgi:D-arabinose 1-dehydrogenase-like Zn-dependent alcohol dehydrogenase